MPLGARLFPLVLNSYLFLMHLKYTNLPLSVKTLYTQFPVNRPRIRRKGKRKCSPSLCNDYSIFGNAFWFLRSSVVSWPIFLLTPATLISCVRLYLDISFFKKYHFFLLFLYNLFLSPNLTSLFFCLLLPAFLLHLRPFSESVHAEQLSRYSCKNTA